MVRVLFANEQFNAGMAWSDLSPLLPGWQIDACARNELLSAVDGADVVCPFGARVDRGVIAAGRFGLVQQFGVGLDAVDIEAATELGVWVSRLPGELTGNADSVAELVVTHVLLLMRRVDEARQALRERRWGQPMGRSLVDSTIVVVGLGASGIAVVNRLRPFGPRILAIRAHPERGAVDGVDRVAGPGELRALAGEADILICCATLDETTRNLFDSGVFGAVRPGALFVNVARGGLVDEPALLDALNSGRLAGAALDVFATEPADPHSALLTHPNVIATPHIAGLTGRTFRNSARLFAGNLRRWAEGAAPEWSANEPPAPRRP